MKQYNREQEEIKHMKVSIEWPVLLHVIGSMRLSWLSTCLQCGRIGAQWSGFHMTLKNYTTAMAQHGHGTEPLLLMSLQICKEFSRRGSVRWSCRAVTVPYSFSKSYKIHSIQTRQGCNEAWAKINFIHVWSILEMTWILWIKIKVKLEKWLTYEGSSPKF